jgi:hypothetical protein
MIPVADYLAEALYDPERVTQQVTIAGGKLPNPDDRFRFGSPTLYGAQPPKEPRRSASASSQGGQIGGLF